MLKLLAAAYADAYAVVQDRDRIYLLRPPFTKREKLLVGTEGLEQAVQRHGFVRAEGQFSSWADLVKNLRESALEPRRAAGQAPPDTNAIRRLVERAPDFIVRRYLDRIDSELIPNREFQAAQGIVAALLKNPVVQTSCELQTRCSTVLDACSADLSDPHAAGGPWENAFPSAPAAAAFWAGAVSQSGQILSLGYA